MNRLIYILIALLCSFQVKAQTLPLKKRSKLALSGSEFANLIADTSLTLKAREALIFKEIKSGNVPDFERKLVKVTDSIMVLNKEIIVTYYVLPDYLAIGSNENYFYCPTTPALAQRIANLCDGSLPTKKMVDVIYKNATIKLAPNPIPPTKQMITVPVFLDHNKLVQKQLIQYKELHIAGALTAGNKKDIIISNAMAAPTARVVIYGWHQLDGKPIQPVYNKHTSDWADYSHGVRLIQNKIWINGKRSNIQKILGNELWAATLSDEGKILNNRYPIE